jgi:hypothetical protein
VALDFYLGSFEQALTSTRVGSVEIKVEEEQWTLGAGERVASIRGERYELFRCLGGRRSESQIRALQWEGDIDAILPIVSRYPPKSTRSWRQSDSTHEVPGRAVGRAPDQTCRSALAGTHLSADGVGREVGQCVRTRTGNLAACSDSS